jgi:hypothetical protein
MSDDPKTAAAVAPTTDLERQPERAPAAMGLVPRSIEEGWRLASMLARSELVPKQFRNRPEDVMVAIQLGAEVGFPPMQALQSIAVINGRPTLWGDGLLALIQRSPRYEWHEEGFLVGDAGAQVDRVTADEIKADSTTAVCTFKRIGAPALSRFFSVAQARRAGLLTKDGPWQAYPDRMLQLRARSFAARDCFADLLRGLRSAEEAQDIDEPTPAAPRRPVVRRMSEASVPPVDEGQP